MEIQHIYTKQRKEFGLRRPIQRLEPQVLMEIIPDPSLLEHFIEAPRQERGISHVSALCEHSYNTRTVELAQDEVQARTQGDDPEQTQRLRKKVEREAGFTTAVERAVVELSPALLLNNAENLTTAYFKPAETVEKQPENCRILASFKDGELVKRSVSQAVFCPEVNRPPRKFAVCYSSELGAGELSRLETKFDGKKVSTSNNAFIFDVSNANEADFVLNSQFPITCLKFSQKDNHIILCGLQTGVVCMYDTRKGTYPISVSEIRHSHKSDVAELKILRSKSGCEFISVGSDGEVLFWDYRDLSKPVENYQLQFEGEGQLSYPLSTLNCELKILAGSESGHIFNINKKTKTIDQILAHHGTVQQLQRHPFHQKYFASCGDWSVKFFADDCRTPLISFISDSEYIDFALSETRPAVFCAVRRNGFLDIYDMFKQLEKPVFSVQIFNTAEAICCDFDQSGRFVIVGGSDGSVVYTQLSDGLVQASSQAQERFEKQWVNLFFEREAKREKTLEMRSKEGTKGQKEEPQEVEIADEGEIIASIVEEYDKLLGQ